MAGRLTLAKSVIQAMPSYIMQSSIVPKTVCDEVDRLCRDFVWGDSQDHRNIHLINWQRVCSPTAEGGLELGSMREMNKGFLLKAARRFCSDQPCLWVEVMRSKYGCHESGFPCVNHNRSGSNLWRGLCSIWPTFRRLLVWRIGQGESALF